MSKSQVSSPSSLPAFDLSGCRYIDQRRFQRRIAKFKRSATDASALTRLSAEIADAEQKLVQRVSQKIQLNYPVNLPVAEKASDILTAIEQHQVVIVAGETGSGKTTQLPKICLEAGLGRRGLIGHTQPRRLAARTVSARIADELNVPLGGLVGYQVRFTDQVSDDTFVKVMTDGILLSEIKHDRDLLKYDAIIIDEAHERSLNIDFLLGCLKQLISRRPELKVVITSATIDVERFSKHFDDAPIVSVSGRTFPVEVEYRPPYSEDEGGDTQSLPEQVLAVVEEIEQQEREMSWKIGDVLVFLPGEREIREVSQHLRHANLRDTEVTPLYARLSNEEQSRIFKSHPGRRIVLSTNVAETSITVPGIRYVVDSGLVRMSRYSYRSKIQRLPIEAISQASANQRKGRCGRVAEGVCYRLYSEDDFNTRSEFTDPEILRTNLASVILKMKDAGLGEVHRFPFVDPPDQRLWNDGYKLLFELGAVDDKERLTKTGQKLAVFPTDPRIARVLLSSIEMNCLSEMLVIASVLSLQDPRERPAEKQSAADQAHAQYKDEESDFVSLLNLWNAYEEQRQELSGNQLKKFCQKNYISYMRMREWRDLHRQLHLLAKPLSKNQNTEPASYESVHRAILSGFLGHLGRHDEKREYQGCRNRKFQVFPGSALAKKKPKWMVSAEIVETQQVYARTNARIDPEWVEPLAEHLVKRSWSEPHWQKKRGQVLAYEKVTLYGLEVVAKRLINFANVDAAMAREIFIRSALVEEMYQSRAPIIRDNRSLISSLEALEDRTRRRDIVVDDDRVFELYNERIPSHIVSAASFEKWIKRSDDASLEALRFSKQDLALATVDAFDPSLYPETLENNGVRFPLRYHFDPSSKEDGVTISVPISAARQVSTNRLEKLVPGLLKEKCLSLIKNLPRSLRKNFVPVPDVVEAIYPKIEASDAPLLESLTAVLKHRTGIEIPYDAWNLDALDKHLRFHIEVVDASGKVIEQGRDLLAVVDKVEHLIDAAPSDSSAESEKIEHYVDWQFGTLSESVTVSQAGIDMNMFPALKDEVKHVALVRCSDLARAEQFTRLGVARLLSFRLKPQLSSFRKQLPDYQKLGLLYAPVGKAQDLYSDFALFCVISHFVGDKVVRSNAEFEAMYEDNRADFLPHCERMCQLVLNILSSYHQITKLMKGKVSLDVALPMSDLKAQLTHLVYPGFLSQTPLARLEHYPRYLDACVIRIEKMARELGKERQYLPLLKQWWTHYLERRAQFEKQGIWDAELEAFRWLIEEQRVSWYAQQLKTYETVSEKRLNKIWESIRRV